MRIWVGKWPSPPSRSATVDSPDSHATPPSRVEYEIWTILPSGTRVGRSTRPKAFEMFALTISGLMLTVALPTPTAKPSSSQRGSGRGLDGPWVGCRPNT